MFYEKKKKSNITQIINLLILKYKINIVLTKPLNCR